MYRVVVFTKEPINTLKDARYQTDTVYAALPFTTTITDALKYQLEDFLSGGLEHVFMYDLPLSLDEVRRFMSIRKVQSPTCTTILVTE